MGASASPALSFFDLLCFLDSFLSFLDLLRLLLDELELDDDESLSDESLLDFFFAGFLERFLPFLSFRLLRL